MQRKYLAKINEQHEPERILHFWNDATQDTACRMLATDGLDSSKQWKMLTSLGNGSLCQVCRANLLEVISQQDKPGAFPCDSEDEQAYADHLRSIHERATVNSSMPVVGELLPQVGHDRQLDLV